MARNPVTNTNKYLWVLTSAAGINEWFVRVNTAGGYTGGERYTNGTFTAGDYAFITYDGVTSDQSFDANSVSDQLNSTNTLAQTFTPTKSNLTGIALRIFNNSATVDFTMTLYKWKYNYATTVAQTPVATTVVAKETIGANYNYKTISIAATLDNLRNPASPRLGLGVSRTVASARNPVV